METFNEIGMRNVSNKKLEKKISATKNKIKNTL